MIESTPTVAVCICTRDRPDEVRGALESLSVARRRPDLVVVSDDGTSPDTRVVAEAAALPVTYLRGPREGLAPNRNRALSAVDTDYVLFIDDDARLGTGFIDAALECMARYELLYGEGQVLITGPEDKRGERIVPSDQDFLGFQRVPYDREIGLNSIVINSTLFPTVLLKRQGFDHRFRYGSEEVEIATRLAARGATIVFCEEAVNAHLPSPLSREDYSLEREASRLYATLKRYLFTCRQPPRAALYVLIAPAHAVAGGFRRRRWAGAWQSAKAVAKAASYTWSYALEARSADHALG
jgi:GT2 family glycosyltransferase